jgi:hypothetical protein
MEPCGSPAPSDPLPVREDRPEAHPNASMDAACRRWQLGPGAGAVVYPLVSAPIGRRPPRKRTRHCRGSRRGRRPPRCLARSIRREATELSGAASLETRSMLLYARTSLRRSSAGPRLESAHSVRAARSRGSEPMRQCSTRKAPADVVTRLRLSLRRTLTGSLANNMLSGQRGDSAREGGSIHDSRDGRHWRHTAFAASGHSRAPIGRRHYQVEEELRESELGWTILRPHHFMQNLLAQLD